MEFVDLNDEAKGKGFAIFDSAEAVIAINAEDCESFSDYLIRRISEEYGYQEYGYLIELKLTFSKESLKKRKYMKPEGYKITCDEVLDYWKNIYDFFVVLESNGYIPRIKYYQPTGVELIIIIGKP